MTSASATSAFAQAFIAVWDTMWPVVATTLPLVHFTTDNTDEWYTTLDPLVVQNPTTGAMRFGTKPHGDTCRCHSLGFCKICGPGLFRLGLTSVDKLRNVQLDASKLSLRLTCGASASQKALVFSASFSDTVQVHGALQGRGAPFVPCVSCKDISITATGDVYVTGVAQFIVPLAPGPAITVGPVTYTGTELMLSASTITITQLNFDLDNINSIVDEIMAIMAVTVVLVPFISNVKVLELLFKNDVNKELKHYVDPTFRKPIRTRLSPSFNATVPIPFDWVCADAASLPPGAAAIMDLQLLGPTQWPCIPSTIDQTPGSGSGSSSLFMLQSACGSDEICAVCGNAYGSACPILPGACVKADCDPLCNTSASGQCCGSQQVCLNKGPQGSCCTPVCRPCESGSDGCGGTCVASCTDPAQHCGSGSAAGQCVNNINVTDFPANANAQGEVVIRAFVHRRFGPVFAHFNTPGLQTISSITLTPLDLPASAPPPDASNFVLPMYFVLMAATGPWATPYVVLPPPYSGGWSLCADTSAQNGNPTTNGGGSSDNPLAMVVCLMPQGNAPPAPFVQFDVRPIVPAGQSEFCYLGAVIPGDPNVYTLSYIGIAGFVCLVAGPAATAGVRTDPADGFVSTLWQLGACNTNADCITSSTVSGFGTCLGNVCFPGSDSGSGSGSGSGSSFGSSFSSSYGGSAVNNRSLQGPPSRFGTTTAFPALVAAPGTPGTTSPGHAAVSTPAIVGIVVGGVVLLLAIVLCVRLLPKNKQARRARAKK